MWQPFGNVGAWPLNVPSLSSPFSKPGSFSRFSVTASSPTVIERSVPRDANPPMPSTTSKAHVLASGLKHLPGRRLALA